MHTLYPLKFSPVFKEKVWGGKRIEKMLGKDTRGLLHCGESWEISGIPGSESVVSNGFLKGNSLTEILEVYMGDLIGEQLYERFGNEFPLLVKFLDANEMLSLQVHPGDELAWKLGKGRGKAEMWYVLDAQPDAAVINGFSVDLDPVSFLELAGKERLPEVLHLEKVSRGDALFIPPGRIHALGGGILLCEIQQASDITYRIYDWGRDTAHSQRPLHLKEAVEALDYKQLNSGKTAFERPRNGSVNLVAEDVFHTNLLAFDQTIHSEYYYVDSFVLYVCVSGKCTLKYNGKQEQLAMGECILLPAEIKQVEWVTDTYCEVLETYIP